ncbi:MAG: amidohydrolase family protein [Deltaproteobacteria bacterium]|nr:amidohydrolase family protein [Deltaproteobacteria bacterium]
MNDIIITGGTVVNHFGRTRCDLSIQNGKIAALGHPGGPTDHYRRIDAEGKLVLPGLIDTHVHLGLVRDFDQDCLTESRAAAAGGVTTILPHLISKNDPLDQLDKAWQAVRRQARVNVGFHLSISSPDHLSAIDQAYAKGIKAFKFFLGYKGHDSRRLGLGQLDYGLLLQAFKKISVKKGLCLVHAEDWDLIQALLPEYQHRSGLDAWHEARADFAEEISINSVAVLARQTGCRLGIVHVSSSRGLEAIRRAKRSGIDIFGEACPQYLTLDCHSPDILAPLTAKITPPVRTREDLECLWDGVRGRDIITSGTDHCSLTKSEKLGTDIWSTRPGFPGLETFLPLLYTKGVREKRITLEDLVGLVSHQNAEQYGLATKGCLLPGYDADIVILDPEKEAVVRANALMTSADFTPFEGWSLYGWPCMTIVAGRVIMENGVIVEDA